MSKKIAIDWDESELRIVVANCSGAGVKVANAGVMPLGDDETVSELLKRFVLENDLQKTETLVTIGRGKAELREIQLPAVPDDELPDMVRFQAIRSFASASERAIVDYLITDKDDEGQKIIAAAVGPVQLDEITNTCQASELEPKRIALRPLATSALYLSNNRSTGEIVMIDLLSLDAEIVIAREGKVIFVRTVRMPADQDLRANGLVGELKRSLLASGCIDSPEKVVIWGRREHHEREVDKIASAVEGAKVEVVNPFDLVSVSSAAKETLPDHVGRLAPLVGLLSADEGESHRLIDFLNPRKREEPEPDRLRWALLIGGPIAAILLMGFFAYKRLSDLDSRIATVTTENASLAPLIEIATKQIGDTERVDQFLDGGVNWLDELDRLAGTMPPSEKMIVRSLSLTADTKDGGGKIYVTGAATDSEVDGQFVASVRDENHVVVNRGAREDDRSTDAYRWQLDEMIEVDAVYVRNRRYEKMLEFRSTEPTPSEDDSKVESDATADEEAANENQNVDENAAESPDSESSESAGGDDPFKEPAETEANPPDKPSPNENPFEQKSTAPVVEEVSA